ncbi:MAG: ORF6N domain-containing protein [Bacteroidia bacterium]
MTKKTVNEIMLPDEVVINKIYLIRNQKVMLDRDLAELYDVETKQLKRQVNRNIERFPKDFMFEMSQYEFQNWRSQFGTSNLSDKMGLRYPPYCFTEHGVLMLSSVLNSPRAIQVNIQIVRIYTKLREMLLTHKDILLKLEEMEKKIGKQDNKIKLVFDYLNQFIKQQEKPRKFIRGFRNEEKQK